MTNQLVSTEEAENTENTDKDNKDNKGIILFNSLDPSAKNKLSELIRSNMPIELMSDYLQLTIIETQALLAHPELKQLVAQEKVKDQLGQFNTANKWDTVEELALKSVIAELHSNPDPDFALRAALAANKSIRHHKQSATNTSNTPTTSERVVTLQLNKQFVNNIVNIQTTQQLTKPIEDKKVVDIFTSKDMERLTERGILNDTEKKRQEIDAYFEELPTDATTENTGGVEETTIKSMGSFRPSTTAFNNPLSNHNRDNVNSSSVHGNPIRDGWGSDSLADNNSKATNKFKLTAQDIDDFDRAFDNL